MSSRVSQYAARLIETCWLAAVMTVPLFFNVWSNRVFEPDKLTLLRSLALVIVAASVIWFLERGVPSRERIKEWLATPLVAPVLALSAVYVLSTVLSVAPRLSLFGSYQRLQGLYTWLAYVVVFVAIVGLLGRRSQLDRLITALILPSLPVALYGIIQNRGLDPMPWLGDVTFRVASTMGNSIFVSAYLIMVVPLTITRITAALRELDEYGDDSKDSSEHGPHAAAAAVLRAASYMVLLIIQVVGIVLSQSRGPLVGIGAALFFLFLLFAALRSEKRTRRISASLVYLVLGVIPAIFLLAFNLAPENSSIGQLREVPYVGRMGRVLETDGGTGIVRVLIWQGAIDLIGSDPARFVVGYGPESMHVAYNPFYPAELAHHEARNASPDRAHNETLDALITTGAIGFLAYMALFTSLFYYALKWLGLVTDARQRNLYLALWFGGGLLFVLGFYQWSGDLTFFGVALPFGMVFGLVNYVFVRALVGWPVGDRPSKLLIAGLTAGIVAHFIEIHFGIAIAATRTLFFTMTGALVVLGALSAARPQLLSFALPAAAERPRNRKGKRSRRPAKPGTLRGSTAAWSSAAFLILVVLSTMTFDFFVRSGIDSSSEQSVQGLLVQIWLFTLTWAIGSLMLGSEILIRPGGTLAGVWRYLAITAGGFVAYLVAHQMILGGSRGADGSSMLYMLYYVVLLTLLALWAYVLTRAAPDPGRTARSRLMWAYPLIIVGAVLIALLTNINEVRADIYYKQAWAYFHGGASNYMAQGDTANAKTYYDSAVASYDRALELDGSEDYYLLFKGKALLEQADAEAADVENDLLVAGYGIGDSEYALEDATLAAAVTQRDRKFDTALDVLFHARETSPTNTDHYANLGRAYQIWGERTFDSTTRAERFAESRNWFEEALVQSPHNAALRTELATTEFLDGDTEAALVRIDEAIELDEKYGRPYRLRATINRQDENWEAAEDDYRSYVESRDGKNDPVGWSGLAYVLGLQGKSDEAIATNVRVLELAPGDLPTLRNLALLHRDLGQTERACEYIAIGLSVAPQDSGLAQLQSELGCGGAGAPGSPSPAQPPVDDGNADS
jgi:tetratricopeptide (TPR) repeat protein